MKHLKKFNEELGPFHMDDEERAEYEKGRININTEDIETKIQDAAYSLRGFSTMTKNAAFINGAKWAIHNLTDAEIKHMRENSDPDDHSFFGL